jgi:putative ABC transport system permease protein
MISSFRSSVADWLTATLSADIYISAPQLTATQASIGFADEIVQQVREVEGVVDVSVARAVQVVAPSQPTLPPVNLTAVLWDTAQDRRRFAWYNAPTPNHQDALDSGQVMVSEAFAFKRGITPANATLTLLTDQGERTFDIFGVFFDYSSDQGTVFMSLETYRQFWNDPQVSSIAAYVEEPSRLDSVIETLKAETLAGYDLVVQSNRTLRDGVFVVFDQAFSITVALRLLATIVAFIGILSALLSLQLENTRQYGLMRAIGLTPQQLGRFTLLQTGLMGLVAGLLAVPIGLALAAVLVFVINIRSFGWSMGFIPLPSELTQAFSVSLVAALLAGVYPAWKLGRLVTARALRAE